MFFGHNNVSLLAIIILLIIQRFQVGCTTVATGNDNDDRAFAVYQIIPKHQQQIQILSDLYENVDEMLDFWRPPSSLNNSVEVMVYPQFKANFTDWLHKRNIPFRIVIADLAETIKKYELPKRFPSRSLLFADGKRQRDYLPTVENIAQSLPMGEYYSYEKIVEWMRNLERLFPNFIRLISIGQTHQGRNIYGLIFGTKRTYEQRVVWIDAGIHSREWASIHTALYFIQQLASGYGKNPRITEYVNMLNIYIFPCLNPDGYEYTRSDPRNPAKRMWRKNLSPEKCYTKNDKKRCCKGVDLNRNFAFRFAEIGSSPSPCSEIHHGDYAFSEPESRAVRDAVLLLQNRIDAFITLHTYSQLWIYPFSHRKYAYSADVNDLKKVAKKAVAKLHSLYGTEYRYGTGPEIIYPYAGGSSDWAKESAGVKYSYTIELRPSYFEWNGFVLDKSQLIPTGRETWAGIQVVLDRVVEDEKRRRGIEIPCNDVSPSCAHWLAQSPSICRTTEDEMEKQCQKTCGFCH